MASAPALFKGTNRMTHVERVAVARIGIDNKRQVHRIADTRGMVSHFVQTDKPQVRKPEKHVGHASAGDIQRTETGIGNNSALSALNAPGTSNARRLSTSKRKALRRSADGSDMVELSVLTLVTC